MVGKPVPLRDWARDQVHYAVRVGKLSKPDECSHCGQKPTPGKDGRSRLHGHHPDHNRPLEVEWLCAVCHRAETPSNHPRGERHQFAKITDAQADEIRRSALSSRAIAPLYGISDRHIRSIRSGEWRRPTPPKDQQR